MKLLAIDTALSSCAAAVLTVENGEETIVAQSEDLGRGHAERIMSMVSGVMAESSTTFNALDRIVVNVGPGSFTGLRIGLSISRGFGLVLGKPVVPVTTLSAIAAEVLVQPSNDRPLLVALDARRDEVYCQTFTAQAEPLGEAKVSTVKDLAHDLPANALLAGSAALAVAKAAGVDSEAVRSEAAYASIEFVARLGLNAPVPQKAPMPLYLRPPDAKPQERGRILRQ
ncbi:MULTISPECIES: tRNA (adenosine(37)-N6)-threonylcarbamoyltransferase complex dimerization subunit type 1 TsaB [Pseudovibrio]|uniref:tRNA (adenosine(37)-N6)-threonylcarbamoyltransferase complex dimerization subunit type 1 TsaB n=1 Tax=Stappiaceae TaxID=2821832 RepID=UPI00236704B9|nr:MULTISPECIES: tRNA (adenosine(37)-N6)-threonylcarbamoyltransferase complex dimerization subunit type 1 TsaB [Pseudovibrio]MDD7909670.1 tRNA (adenosine(37)-N6)-threonylcarbamoyltransferase complex dimerization subunit type 1 TsaB [Pseudovibrio exalbescens]MDX5592012.1 tRNA (adenosine(37)-N6)-threonylcarbamoyltransferase complex dimerization subunit type 1 TsaB [Pseudovibrio sp. SPO723]